MRRIAAVPGALAVGLVLPALALSSLPAVSAPAEAGTGTSTVTGRVATVVGERHAGPDRTRLETTYRQVLITRDGVLRLPEGDRWAEDSRVTVEVAGSGDRQRVTDVVDEEAAPAQPSAAAFTGTRQVYVAIVSPKGRSKDYNTNTTQSVTSLVDQASSYWSSQTGGKVSFQVAQVLPKYVSAYACNPEKMWNEAIGKFGDTEVQGTGKHLLLVTPDGSDVQDGCYYGWAYIGTSLDFTRNRAQVSASNPSLYAHELGHNIGLEHSNGLRCKGTQDGRYASDRFQGCTANEYDDLLDVMGYSGRTYGEGSLNGAHIDDLGLQPTHVETVGADSARDAVLRPLSATGSAPRVVKVVDRAAGAYFVEYRTATGRDEVADRNQFRPQLGVRITRENPRTYYDRGSLIVDPTPSALRRTDYNRALPVGGVFRSASNRVTVRLVGQGTDSATVRVITSSTSLVPTQATITGPRSVRKGAYAKLSTTVTDGTGTATSYWKVKLQVRNTDGRWVTLRNDRTGIRGSASTKVQVKRTSSYRWVTAASNNQPKRISPKRTVRIG